MARQLSDGNSDGTYLGQGSTDKVGLYGVTPIAQRSGAAQTAVATTVAVSTVAGGATSWGFGGSTQANAIVTLVNELRAAMVAIGAISGAA